MLSAWGTSRKGGLERCDTYYPAEPHHGKVLKGQVALVTEIVRRLGLDHNADILNTDAILTILVVTGFYKADVRPAVKRSQTR